jgi:hypothetical protein
MPKVQLTMKPLPVACFAPELTDERLARYEVLANALPDSRGEVRDAMRECLAAAKLWWQLPESKGDRKDQSLDVRHQNKDRSVKLTSLTPDLVEQLWDAVPWPYELDAMQSLFDRTFQGREEAELKDACFHLLWFARELCLDREPLTQEKLGD